MAPTAIYLQLADQSTCYIEGIAIDLLVQIRGSYILLTPFLGTCLGWQDKVAVRCGLPMREKLNVTGSNMVPMAR